MPGEGSITPPNVRQRQGASVWMNGSDIGQKGSLVMVLSLEDSIIHINGWC